MANLLSKAQEILQNLEEQSKLNPKDIRDSGLAVNLALLGLASSAIKRIKMMIEYIERTEDKLMDDSRIRQLNTRELLEVYTTLQDYHAKQIDYLQQVSKLDLAKIEALLAERELQISNNDSDKTIDPSLMEDLVKKAFPDS